jgi:hypothetical protein
MRWLGLALVLGLALGMMIPGARADQHGFGAPHGIFIITAGTFQVPAGMFQVQGEYKVPSGTFRPEGSFKPEQGAFLPHTTFTVPQGQFRPPAGEFVVQPGTYYIGHGFLTRK